MTSASTPKQIAARPLVRLWLLALAGLVFAMVVVGGATRLTHSGLSITEWNVILGVIPPLDQSHWQAAFEKYQTIPEFELNRGMSLEEFKFIYWWEWSHRLLGRFIGFALIVPLVVFWATGRLERRLLPRLLGLFVLGGLQGALGWFMVKSGLAERVDVSQYRLAAHLTLATIIYAAILWTAWGIGREGTARRRSAPALSAAVISALVLLQVFLGGLVAGLDAGQGYNTWPLMEGRLVPQGLFIMEPWWRNLFENAMTVQFDHRVVAYLVSAAIVLQVFWFLRRGRDASAWFLLAALLLQVALGVSTLLLQVPLGLALLHQAGALLLLTAALYHLRSLRDPWGILGRYPRDIPVGISDAPDTLPSPETFR